MDRPIIRDGAVVISGEQITDLGDAREMRAKHPDAALMDLTRSILLPGLVNAHTHLELTACHAAAFTGRFVDWIIGIRDRIKLDPANIEPSVRASIDLGVKQCLQ